MVKRFGKGSQERFEKTDGLLGVVLQGIPPASMFRKISLWLSSAIKPSRWKAKTPWRILDVLTGTYDVMGYQVDMDRNSKQPNDFAKAGAVGWHAGAPFRLKKQDRL